MFFRRSAGGKCAEVAALATNRIFVLGVDTVFPRGEFANHGRTLYCLLQANNRQHVAQRAIYDKWQARVVLV